MGESIRFHIVVAVDSRGGIGKNGALPWQLPGDMAFFRRLTTDTSGPDTINAVIMGRKTWDSIPPRFRPLKKRLNVVITRQQNLELPEGVNIASSFEEALAAASQKGVESIFVIGGGSIYEEACRHDKLDCVFWTDVRSDFDCDTFFPVLQSDFVHVREQDSELLCENGTEYVFKIFKKNPTEPPSKSILNVSHRT